MAEYITIKHSFNAGDLIILLPGLQKIYQDTGKKTVLYQRLNLGAFYYDGAIHPITHDNIPVCMNQDMFDRMKPLIEAQKYIERFEIWEGQDFDYDIDLTRESKWIPMPSGLIHQWPWCLAPEMSCDLSTAWVYTHNHSGEYRDKIIINRTERYINPYISYFFLKEHEKNLIFSGTQRERDIFCEQFKLDIPLLVTENFLQVSEAIASCKLFIGNQSLHWHIADSQKIPRILELSPQFPNTFATGAFGHQFYHQKNLEYYFNELTLDTKDSDKAS